jgi:hypothetical protein
VLRAAVLEDECGPRVSIPLAMRADCAFGGYRRRIAVAAAAEVYVVFSFVRAAALPRGFDEFLVLFFRRPTTTYYYFVISLAAFTVFKKNPLSPPPTHTP